jgi:hypothetical protein
MHAAMTRLALVLASALLAFAAAPALAAPPASAAHGRPLAEQPTSPDDGTATDDTSDDPTADDGEDGAEDDPADDTTDAATCDDQDVVNPFERWNDDGDYTLAADFEDDLEDWTLEGGARVADGNERFDVGDEGDSGSLLLRAGASATSAPICVPDGAAFGRLFTRAAKGGRLRIDVLAVDADGSRRAATLRGRGRGWRLSRRIDLDAGDGATEVAVRFTAIRGSWRVDDLYVDAG